MVHASVQIDQLHPPMSEPLKGIDLRWIDDVLDYAGDHTRSVTNRLDSEGVLDLRRKLLPSLLAHVRLQPGMVATLTTFRVGAGEAVMPTPMTRALIGRVGRFGGT